MPCAGQTLTLTYPAEPESVGCARHALSDFAATAGADDRLLDAIRLAISEAITNVVRHGYHDGRGSVYVTAAAFSDELWILVSDDGCGLQPRPDRPGLGLGLALISQVSEEMSVAPRATGGTEVRMRFAIVPVPARGDDAAPTVARATNPSSPAGARGRSRVSRARRPA